MGLARTPPPKVANPTPTSQSIKTSAAQQPPSVTKHTPKHTPSTKHTPKHTSAAKHTPTIPTIATSSKNKLPTPSRTSSPLKQLQQEKKRPISPSELDPFKKKPKLIRSPPHQNPTHQQQSSSKPQETQSALTSKPSSIPLPINPFKSPKCPKAIATPANHPTPPSDPFQSTTQLTHQPPTLNPLPPAQSNLEQPDSSSQSQSGSESESEQHVPSPQTCQIPKPTSSTELTLQVTALAQAAEDSSIPSTSTSADLPAHPLSPCLQPAPITAPVSNTIKHALKPGHPHKQPIHPIKPLNLPTKIVPSTILPEPASRNESNKSVRPEAHSKPKPKEKNPTISNQAPIEPKRMPIPQSPQLPSSLQPETRDDYDLSRESNLTTDFGSPHDREFMEQRIQELEQIIKLMENEKLEVQLKHDADEAQSVWDKEFGAEKKMGLKVQQPNLSIELCPIDNQFELEMKSLELKQIQNDLVIKECESRLLIEKIDQLQSDYQSREELLMNELERLRMTNSEWAQIGQNFESLIEIERREKEELENRFQIEMKQTKLEPNFEINNLKYQIIKSENRSELLEEQLQEILDKSKNLETQLMAEKAQRNKVARDLESANLNIKSLSDQILDLTSALSEQQKGEGKNQRSLSQELLNARAALAEKEIEIANLRVQISAASHPPSQPPQQRLEPENQPTLARKRASKKVASRLSISSHPQSAIANTQPVAIDAGAGPVEKGDIVDVTTAQTGEQNELPGDHPLRQITADHWVSIGVVAKKIDRTRNKKSSQSPAIDVTTNEAVAAGSTHQDRQTDHTLPLQKNQENSNPSSSDSPTEQPALSSNGDSGLIASDINQLIQKEPISANKTAVKSQSKPTTASDIPAKPSNNKITKKAKPINKKNQPETETEEGDNNDDHDDEATKNKVPPKPAQRGRPPKVKKPEPAINHVEGDAPSLDEGSTAKEAVVVDSTKSLPAETLKGKRARAPTKIGIPSAWTDAPTARTDAPISTHTPPVDVSAAKNRIGLLNGDPSNLKNPVAGDQEVPRSPPPSASPKQVKQKLKTKKRKSEGDNDDLDNNAPDPTVVKSGDSKAKRVIKEKVKAKAKDKANEKDVEEKLKEMEKEKEREKEKEEKKKQHMEKERKEEAQKEKELMEQKEQKEKEQKEKRKEKDKQKGKGKQKDIQEREENDDEDEEPELKKVAKVKKAKAKPKTKGKDNKQEERSNVEDDDQVADPNIEHEDDDHNENQSFTNQSGTTKEKKKDGKSQKSEKKKNDQLSAIDKSADHEAEEDQAVVVENQPDEDSSLNIKKKKRKLFHQKQQNLNWANEDDNNMLGLPPQLSPVKKSTSSHALGGKDRKKISSNNILPMSLLK